MIGRVGARAGAATLRPVLLAAALVVAAVLPVRAGGPLQVVNNQPVVYPNGGAALTLNLDQGPLGSRTNAEAVALVQGAIALWNGVPTSTLRLAIGTPLPFDYTSTNYSGIHNNSRDGVNPVLFDTDGSIVDQVYGAGASSSILGFAGSSYYISGPSAGRYREGRAVLNGAIAISDATWKVVLAHEFGHFFGLDHSQLDSAQGLQPSNYVLMYPIAVRTLVSLHEDDVAAVSALYPAAGVAAAYGQLTGTFTTVAGAPILGANIWAREVATGRVYSIVSDFLLQGTGYFRLYLPPGTYTLGAESIDQDFVGGSSVGPYAETSGDASFQSPHPITPVKFGGTSVRQLAISAGCVGTVTFRLDGSGSAVGNCAGAPAPTTTALVTSQTPITGGVSVTFTATVTGTAPGGTVAFKDGASTIANCGAVALTGSGNARAAACSTAALTVGTHSITAVYGGDAANASSTSNTVTEVVNAPPPPALVGAVSRKVHGAAGSFDLPLALAVANPATEPRSGSTLTLVLTFDQPIASAQVAVTEGVATSSGIAPSGNSVTITLTGVATEQYVTVALTNVASSIGGTGGSGRVRLGLLVGDINGSRNVTLTDMLGVNAVLSQATTAANFLRDINASGSIGIAAKLAVSANLSRALPVP
jgi:hypothetical protein